MPEPVAEGISRGSELAAAPHEQRDGRGDDCQDRPRRHPVERGAPGWERGGHVVGVGRGCLGDDEVEPVVHVVRILPLDDKATPSLARSVARRAIAAKAVGVIGPYNSSVGIINLPLYVAGKVVPIHLTSTDETTGKGLTVQPKNSQISPVEARYFATQRATRVAMLVDPSTYTKGMADRLRRILRSRGSEVATVPIVAGKQSYSSEVAEALSAKAADIRKQKAAGVTQ